VGAAAAAWPLAARGQQRKAMRRIGVLMPYAAKDPQTQARNAAFLQGLLQLGWSVGDNVQIDYRWSGGSEDETRKYAAELVALAPGVIFPSGSAAVEPLRRATRTVPIVFALAPGSSWRGLRRELGAARRQHYRFFPVGIRHRREMVGITQADC